MLIEKVSTLLRSRSYTRRMFVTVLLVCGVVLYVAKRDSFQLGVYTDDAEYLILAQAIATGDPYRVSLSPGISEISKYPVGWPLLVALFAPIVDWDLNRLPWLSGLITVAAALTFIRASRSLGVQRYWMGAFAGALFAVTPSAVSHSAMLMSEPFFLLISIAALWLFDVARGESDRWWLAAVCAGAMLLLVLLTRSLGVALGGAVGAAILLDRSMAPVRRLSICVALSLGAFLLACAIVGLSSIGWTDLYAGASVYTAEVGNIDEISNVSDESPSILHRMANGIGEYGFRHVRDVLVPFVGSPRAVRLSEQLGVPFLPDLIGVLVSGIVIFGFLWTWSNSRRMIAPHLFVVFYLLLILSWPWRGVRFLYPLSPFLLIYFLEGGYVAAQILLKRMQRQAVVHSLALLMAMTLGLLYVVRSARIDSSIVHTPDLRAGTGWLRSNSDLSTIVAIEAPRTVPFVYARRSVVPLEAHCDLPRSCELSGVNYVLIRPPLEWHAVRNVTLSHRGSAFVEWAERHSDRIERVYHDVSSQVSVYSVIER